MIAAASMSKAKYERFHAAVLSIYSDDGLG